MMLPFPWSIAVLAAYTAANLAASAQAAIAQRRATYLALMPIAFLSLHLAYGLGSAWGCAQLAAHKLFGIRHATRHTWKPEEPKSQRHENP
jgi:hypothetical protein